MFAGGGQTQIFGISQSGGTVNLGSSGIDTDIHGK